MASRNTDGSIKTQATASLSIRHNGGRLIVSDSDDDTVDAREQNTSVRA